MARLLSKEGLKENWLLLLLVFGASALRGGLKHRRQQFHRTAAGLSSTLLVLSAVALFVPAIFHLVAGIGPGTPAGGAVAGAAGVVTEQTLSLEISGVLIVTYVLSLVFS